MLLQVIIIPIITLGAIPEEGIDMASPKVIKISAFIAEREGFEPTAKWDVRQYSVGYGTNLQYAQKHGLRGKTISKPLALKILYLRVEEDLPKLRAKIPTLDSLSVMSQAALLSAFYNAPALIGPNLRRFIAEGNFEMASFELALGHDPKGKIGLVNRRVLEANVIRVSYGLSPITGFSDIKEFEKHKAGYLAHVKKMKAKK